jgi:hypothetical protein
MGVESGRTFERESVELTKNNICVSAAYLFETLTIGKKDKERIRT